MTWKTWFKRLMIGYCLITVLMLILSEVILIRANEHIFGHRVSEVQMKEEILYGTALLQDESIKYKIDMYKFYEPQIITLGSSRVLQFRELYFKNATFYNIGTPTYRSVGIVASALQELQNVKKPEIIILNVDWRWLNPHFNRFTYDFADKSELTRRFERYKTLWYELCLGENMDLKKNLLYPKLLDVDAIGGRRPIGLMAAVKSKGYRPDGSYQYSNWINDYDPKEKRFLETYGGIREGTASFERASDIDYAELAKLQEVIRSIKAQGSQLIVFLPPFPEEIYNAMLESDGHRDFMLKFEAAVRELCRQEQTSFYDFSNGAWLNAPDEEFLDGFHGSERTYGKIMLKMAEDPILKPYVNKEYIEKRLQESAHPFQIVPLTE